VDGFATWDVVAFVLCGFGGTERAPVPFVAIGDGCSFSRGRLEKKVA
jgi:hypothetical protein